MNTEKTNSEKEKEMLDEYNSYTGMYGIIVLAGMIVAVALSALAVFVIKNMP